MKNKLLCFLFLILFTISACQQNRKNSNQSPNAQPTMTAASNNKIAGDSKIKTSASTGIITKINLEIVSVELNHEEIKGVMPAMQMEFYVTDKSQLEVLKVGDKVNFILEDNAGVERIIEIKK